MNSIIKFDGRVAIEAILYLASRSKYPTFHHIFKLLYLADRCHLARYGRLIYGDCYVAMKHGPVPSSTYDILKSIRHESAFAPTKEMASSISVRGNHHIVAMRPANLEWLSDSDIECLDEALRKYDAMSFEQLTNLTHDDAWKSADKDDIISFAILVKSVDKANKLDGSLLAHLENPFP